MADNITFDPESSDAAAGDLAALDAALEQARIELQAMTDAASTASVAASAAPANAAPFSVHQVEGVGRYIVPRFTGWRALDALIHDPLANIDFSEIEFPLFDNVIANRFNSPPFLDPADDGFPSYQSLRDNIAAVRNFLMESFYGSDVTGLTPEQAKAALEDIATFVGDGLYNNWRVTVLGIPILGYHDPNKPFLSINEARATGGAGAQYIYEKILERQRRSDWLKPFDAVREFFGWGKPAHWHLPPANTTGFTDIFAKDLAAGTPSKAQITSAMLAAAAAKVSALEAKRSNVNGKLQLNHMSGDLDHIGDQLLHTAHSLDDVSTLAEPVRMDAIAIARDILNKLKISIGNQNILDGLKLKPTDGLATFGAMKGVSEVFTRLLAWGRGIDPTILNHPGIQAATEAIGQLGYLAKLQALEYAKAAGNTPRVQQLSAQLKAIDQRFAAATDATFGGLLGKVENGINLILERVNAKNVPGASASHSLGNELGSYMSGTPTAGLGLQVGGDGNGAQRDAVGKRNADMQLAEEAHLQQAMQLQQQNAQRDKNRGQSSGAQTAPARPAPGTGRVAVQQAQRQQRQQATTAATTATTQGTGALSAAQRQQLARNALLHANHEAEERHAHDQHQQQLFMQQKAMQAALQKVNMNKIQQSVSTAGLNTAPVTTNRAAFAKIQAEQAAAAAKAKTGNPDAMKDPQQPPPPPNKNNGRGF
ncbi:MAG: hypothetical protein ACKVOE_06910 [Rickettsiales bacterium]